jgi:hypothetical protein
MNGPGLALTSAAGGPVGAPPGNGQQAVDNKMELNTYIYDHLLRTNQFDLARDFKQQNPCRTKAKGKPNGVSDMDSKENPRRPDDLPDADVLPFLGDSSFLSDWWTMFWDLFVSARSKAGANGTSSAYLVSHIVPRVTKLTSSAATATSSASNAGPRSQDAWNGNYDDGRQANDWRTRYVSAQPRC